VHWGRHRKDIIYETLQELQTAWITSGNLDVSTHGGATRPEDDTLQALRTAEQAFLSGQVPSASHLEIWSFRPAHMLRVLREDATCASLVAHLTACGTAVEVVALGEGSSDLTSVGQEGALASVLAFVPSRVNVVKHMRRHLNACMPAWLSLPHSLDSAEQAQRKEIRHCSCVSAVLLLPPHSAAASVPLGAAAPANFEFDRLMKAGCVQAHHVFGLPLIIRASVAGAQVQPQEGQALLDDFVAQLARIDGAAIFVAKAIYREAPTAA